MSTNVYYNTEIDNWDKMMHRKCECGHDLYQHGFTMHQSSIGNHSEKVLWVSQCVMCKDCDEFHPKKEKSNGSTKV